MNDEDLVEGMKALAHPLRLRIMQSLEGKERNVGQIEEAAAIGQPALSQQLAVLRNAGLVKTRKEAKLVYYRIDESRLSGLVEAMQALGGRSRQQADTSRRPAPGVANFARMA